MGFIFSDARWGLRAYSLTIIFYPKIYHSLAIKNLKHKEMAVCSVYPLNPNLLSHSLALSLSHHSHAYLSAESVSRIRRKGRKGSMTVRALSTHSNAKILNPKRKSRYGHTFSLYDTDTGLDEWLLDVSFCFTLHSLPFNFNLPCLSLCLAFCLQFFLKKLI